MCTFWLLLKWNMLLFTSIHILCTYISTLVGSYIFCKTLLLRCLSCYKHVTSYVIQHCTKGFVFTLRYIARLTVRTTEYYIGVKCAIPPPCTPISSAYDIYPLEILIVYLIEMIFTTHTYEASYGLMMSGLVLSYVWKLQSWKHEVQLVLSPLQSGGSVNRWDSYWVCK